MKPINVGLLWHSLESANLGVGALTHAQIHLLTEAAQQIGRNVTFSMIGWVRDGEVSAQSGVVASCQINARSVLGFDASLNRTLAACDLVLDIGEGDSFSDIYGWKRLFYLIVTKVRASSGRRRLIMSPQTIGPFKHPVTAWLGDIAMNRADVVFSRDALSTRYLYSRRIASPFHEAVDVAFALPFEARARETDKVQVGINVSGLLWAGGYTGANQFGLKLDYRATVLALVDHFLARPGVDVVLVPHVVTAERQEEDDLHAAREIAALRPSVLVAGPFDSPMAAKSYISGLDFFTGARMHACIAAFSSGVPCVPMAYSRKFTGLFNTLEYGHVADCTAEDQAAVVRRIQVGFDARDELAAQVGRGNRIAQERLTVYRQKLTEVLREVAHA